MKAGKYSPRLLLDYRWGGASSRWGFKQALDGYLFYADVYRWPEVCRATFGYRDSRLMSVDTRLAGQDKPGAAVECSKRCTHASYTLRRGGDATLVCRHQAANLCRR